MEYFNNEIYEKYVKSEEEERRKEALKYVETIRKIMNEFS